MLGNALRLARIGAKAGFRGKALPATAGLAPRAAQVAGAAGRRVAKVYENPIGGFVLGTAATLPLEMAIYGAMMGGSGTEQQLAQQLPDQATQQMPSFTSAEAGIDPVMQAQLQQMYAQQDQLARTDAALPTSRGANSDRFVRQAMEELSAGPSNPFMDGDLGRMIADPNSIYGGGYQRSLRSGY